MGRSASAIATPVRVACSNYGFGDAERFTSTTDRSGWPPASGFGRISFDRTGGKIRKFWRFSDRIDGCIQTIQ